MAKQRIWVDPDKVIELYNEGYGYERIAKALNTSPWSCRKVLTERGYHRETKIPDEVIEKVRNLYVDEGMSLKEVARRLNRSEEQINNILNNHKLYRNKNPHKVPRRCPEGMGIHPSKVKIHHVDDPIFYIQQKPTNEQLKYHGKQYRDVSLSIMGG